MRLVFLDNEPLERNINRLADRVRLNAIVNVAKQEVKESARLTAVIFKAIDISDVSIDKAKENIIKIQNLGHTIGMHGFNHENFSELNENQICN